MRVQYIFTFVYISFCLFPFTLAADDYTVQWADTIDNGDWDGGASVAKDHSYNIICVGSSFIGGNTDYFIVKYDSSGTILWTDTLDNGNEDYCEAVAVDNYNNIIVTGYCMINGDYDYYTVKYDSGGTILWQDTLDNNGLYDIARGIAVDNEQNIVVTGYCDIGNDCVYLTVKYDPGGAIIWIDTLDYGPFDSALDVAVDNANNIIVTGYTSNGINNDYFTVKYDSNGTILWQESLGICQYDQAYGVAADNSKNIIVTGCSGEALEDYDFFTVKYDSSGTILWADTLDYEDTDDVAYDIAVDNDNNIYVTGYSLPLSGDYNFFTVKYDSNGTILWQEILDNGNNDIAYGIAVDEHKNIIVTGRSYIAGNMDFFTVKYAPGPGISEYKETSIGTGQIQCQVRPNPFSEYTKITYNIGHCPKDIKFSIYNVTGKMVRSYTIPNTYSPLSTTLYWDGTDNNGDRLPNGVYYLMIGRAKKRVIEKLILIR